MTEKNKTNPMKEIKIEKITLNLGVGKSEDLLKKGLILLQKLTPIKPVKTITKKRIPGWGLRPGLAIGCKVTIRNDCNELLLRLLAAKDNMLDEKNFDDNGNFSFGIPEYIDIKGLDYDPELKIIGLEAAVTLKRPGFRVKVRKIKSTSLGSSHKVSKEDTIMFVKGLGIEVR
ncbi:MAG: 50S ribosomal protein L5 [Nanoarchaeota archaeon]|nr:50S ribosomal protein L5 [Nanoarchaeota archaeon]MBU1632763.1 50S ribosomal protein L5 [Nanoarchaeota archaeon]MBU1876397.1 50S ribosomal protein L5 [Nanoarchaeota archaeon]